MQFILIQQALMATAERLMIFECNHNALALFEAQDERFISQRSFVQRCHSRGYSACSVQIPEKPFLKVGAYLQKNELCEHMTCVSVYD